MSKEKFHKYFKKQIIESYKKKKKIQAVEGLNHY